MKKIILLPIIFVTALIFISACNSKPSAESYLKDDSQRKAAIIALVQHQPYMKELMNEMMNNDSCKQMMMGNMMNDPKMKEMQMNKMMSMCKEDTSMCKMMMGKTMEMCEDDSTKCKMMMGSIKSRPNIMKSIKKMCDMQKMD